MAFVYILVFAIGDFILYSVLSRKSVVKKELAVGYAVLFIAFMLLHLSVFSLHLPVPFKQIVLQLIFIFTIVVVHSAFAYVITRYDNHSGLSEGVKTEVKRALNGFGMIVLYLSMFLMQIVFVLIPVH